MAIQAGLPCSRRPSMIAIHYGLKHLEIKARHSASNLERSWVRIGNLGFCNYSLIHKSLRRRRGVIIAAESAANTGSGSWEKARPRLSDVVWPAAGAFVAMTIMGAVDKVIASKGLTFTIAPFGAVCTVLFAVPTSPAARKYNMFVSHIGCAGLGVMSLAVFGPGWIARSVALAASVAFMIYTDSVHPPAAGLPILFIDGPKFHHLQWWYSIFPGAAGCILLCLLLLPALLACVTLLQSRELLLGPQQQQLLPPAVAIVTNLLSTGNM